MMSRSLLIKGTYKNNKVNCVGLHNSKNSELATSYFTNENIEELNKKYIKYFYSNFYKFKKIEILYNVSDYKGKTKEGKYMFTIDNDTFKHVINQLVITTNNLEV
jgi:hypothetical protein